MRLGEPVINQCPPPPQIAPPVTPPIPPPRGPPAISQLGAGDSASNRGFTPPPPPPMNSSFCKGYLGYHSLLLLQRIAAHRQGQGILSAVPATTITVVPALVLHHASRATLLPAAPMVFAAPVDIGAIMEHAI